MKLLLVRFCTFYLREITFYDYIKVNYKRKLYLNINIAFENFIHRVNFKFNQFQHETIIIDISRQSETKRMYNKTTQ